MKKATSEFDIDNGTVYEGQELPDSHPAVARYPEKFTDVEDPAAVETQPPANDPQTGEPVGDEPEPAPEVEPETVEAPVEPSS